jgi:hypothetical protein
MERAPERTALLEAARVPSFGEWASREIERLLDARSTAATPDERAEVELRLAVVYDAAGRYGRSLAEVSEL